jgi:hypothetical protein
VAYQVGTLRVAEQAKLIPILEQFINWISTMLCDFGCGRLATHTFKSSGKNCCEKSCNSCPARRSLDSSRKKGINPFEGREHPRGALGHRPWSAGKTKDTDPKVAAMAEKLSVVMKGRPKTEETRKKLSDALKGRSGGYRINSGQGRKGRYNGIWCDSSWELAFVLWCELHGRKVKRANEKFPYEYNGVVRNYYPDFLYTNILSEWVYVEVKGYKSEQWAAKLAAFPHALLVADRDLMESWGFSGVIIANRRDFICKYDVK